MKQALKTIGFMVLIAFVFGAGVTGIRLATRETLERNRDLAFQRALVTVFSLAEGETNPDYAKLYRERIVAGTMTDPQTGRDIPVYTAYADATRQTPAAVGFAFTGLGFWGPISGVVALDLDRRTTRGLVILEQQETPGLGGRVAEEEFTGQFRRGLTIAADAERSLRVDTITGATQTSMAMDRMLNEALLAYGRAWQAANQGGQTDGLR
ncbi:MAG: FMN-binding protein [Lentisphaeria bacterium]|jgi:Na+-transporting NADH:ubiquinone oxidoreductase subunit C|nr:FMN-binding protein [Lentisphaeria bacterium]